MIAASEYIDTYTHIYKKNLTAVFSSKNKKRNVVHFEMSESIDRSHQVFNKRRLSKMMLQRYRSAYLHVPSFYQCWRWQLER